MTSPHVCVVLLLFINFPQSSCGDFETRDTPPLTCGLASASNPRVASEIAPALEKAASLRCTCTCTLSSYTFPYTFPYMYSTFFSCDCLYHTLTSTLPRSRLRSGLGPQPDSSHDALPVGAPRLLQIIGFRNWSPRPPRPVLSVTRERSHSGWEASFVA